MDIKNYSFLRDANALSDGTLDHTGEYGLRRTNHVLRVNCIDNYTGCNCWYEYPVYERQGKALPPTGVVMDWDSDVVCLGTDFGYRIISKETGKIITECSL